MVDPLLQTGPELARGALVVDMTPAPDSRLPWIEGALLMTDAPLLTTDIPRVQTLKIEIALGGLHHRGIGYVLHQLVSLVLFYSWFH